MLPTGRSEPTEIGSATLGTKTFDDAYVAPAKGAPFVLAGGGKRIEVAIGEGYPFAQVYAPQDNDVIAYEPMTAPANALITGGSDLPVVEPGDSYAATFSITVSGVPDG
jgi:aldose 1-epimerase